MEWVYVILSSAAQVVWWGWVGRKKSVYDARSRTLMRPQPCGRAWCMSTWQNMWPHFNPSEMWRLLSMHHSSSMSLPCTFPGLELESTAWNSREQGPHCNRVGRHSRTVYKRYTIWKVQLVSSFGKLETVVEASYVWTEILVTLNEQVLCHICFDFLRPAKLKLNCESNDHGLEAFLPFIIFESWRMYFNTEGGGLRKEYRWKPQKS